MIYKLLVAEADGAVVDVLTSVVNMCAHTFRLSVATTTQDARRLARLERPDIAIVDSVLDGPDGSSLVAFLKTLDDETVVIATTTDGSAHHVASALRRGASDFLVKPVQTAAFEAALDRAIERRGAPRMIPMAAKVLLIASETMGRQLTGVLLSGLGMTPQLAADAQQGRAILAQGDTDLVLLDRGGGPGQLDLLTQLRGEGVTIPIIVLLGEDAGEAALVAIRSGADDVAFKPLDREALFDTVQRLHRRHLAAKKSRQLVAERDQFKGEASRAERRLAESLESSGGVPGQPSLLTVALRSLPAGVVVTDDEGRVVHVNTVAKQLLEIPSSDAAGQALKGYPALAPFAPIVARVLTSGRALYDQDLTLDLARGRRTMGYAASPIGEGSPLGAVVFFQDITSKKKAEAQRQQVERLASLGMIATGLNLELASSIQMDGWYAELIRRDAHTDPARCVLHADKLKLSLDRMGQLLSQMGRLLQAPRRDLGPCDLHEILHDVCTMLERKVMLGSQMLGVALNATSTYVMGESLDFEHVMLCLMVSATQGLAPGTKVEVETASHSGVFELVLRAVGPGVSASLPPPLEGLATEERSVDRELGLAFDMCRRITGRLGGVLRHHVARAGARIFQLRLPAALPEECGRWAVTIPPVPLAVPKSEVGSLVAVAGHSEEAVAAIAEWIQESGWCVATHPRSEEALQAVIQDRPGVFVVDATDEEDRWMGFLRKADQRQLPPMVVIVEESLAPRILANLEDLPRVRIVRRPIDPVRVVQAVALAQLLGPGDSM